MDQARAERAAKPDLGSAAEPLAHRSGSPAGAKRANARQHDLAISRPDCPLQHRTWPIHEGTFLPRGPVRPSSLARPPCRAQHHPAYWRGRGRVTEKFEQSTSPGSALFAFASPYRVCQATPTAPRRRNELRAEGSQRHDGRRQENAGRPPGSTRPAGASPIAITLREPQRPNPRRARNGGSAPRPLHLTTGNFPSAAPGPRPVARAPDSRCGRPVHRVRWPAPGRRYPAHCG